MAFETIVMADNVPYAANVGLDVKPLGHGRFLMLLNTGLLLVP